MSRDEPLSRFERSVLRLMLAGVWISSVLLTAGLTMFLAGGDAWPGEALMRAGLFSLMATPILRIVLSVGEALRQRDYFWLWSTLAVMAILLATVLYSLSV